MAIASHNYLLRTGKRTEELLGLAVLLNDLNGAGSQLLDARNVAGEDTHVSGLGGNVDLDTVGSRSSLISFNLLFPLHCVSLFSAQSSNISIPSSGRRKGLSREDVKRRTHWSTCRQSIKFQMSVFTTAKAKRAINGPQIPSAELTSFGSARDSFSLSDTASA